jgi:phage baseplate assembly protein W
MGTFVDRPSNIVSTDVTDLTQSLEFQNRIYTPNWVVDLSLDKTKYEISDRDVIRQAIITILMTMPGERLFNIHYGINLARYVFEQFPNAAEIKSDISTAINKYEPRVIFGPNDMNVRINQEESWVEVDLRYIIKADSSEQRLTEKIYM